MDGAIGTGLWEIATAHGVDNIEPWRYNIEAPELVTELHEKYIEAGSKIILTNTFSANSLSLTARKKIQSAPEAVKRGVEIARKAAEGTDVKVALSIGSLPGLLEPYGNLTVAKANEVLEEQMGTGVEAGADLFFIETFFDIEAIKIAVKIAKQYDLPVFASMTFEQKGRTLMGNSVADIVSGLEPMGVDAIGINCSLGPDNALPILKEYSEHTDLPLIFKPNAGTPITNPDGTIVSTYDVDTFVRDLLPAAEYATYIGGCCGSNAEYIRKFKALLDAQQ